MSKQEIIDDIEMNLVPKIQSKELQSLVVDRLWGENNLSEEDLVNGMVLGATKEDTAYSIQALNRIKELET